MYRKATPGCNGLNGADVLKSKRKDDVEVLQSAETIDKSPILIISELLAQTRFVENGQDDLDSEIN